MRARTGASRVAVIPWLALGMGCMVGNTHADDLNPVTFRARPSGRPVVLVRRGEAVGRICLMTEKPSRQLREAVQELAECIELATGAKLTVVKGRSAAVLTRREPQGRSARRTTSSPALVIGDCDEAARAGLVGSRMPPEGFSIKTVSSRTAPGRVFIVGNDDPRGESPRAASHGTAWGVFEFLERFVNVRWYYPTERGGRSIIKRESLIIEPVWLEDAPRFSKREIWPPCGEPRHGGGLQLTPLHTRLRAGNSWPVSLVVHSPNWGRVEEYRKTRPEVFQRRSDGTRNFGMICYGHPRTLDTYLENIAFHFDRGKAGKKAHMGVVGDAITVSPGDAAIACTCEHCRRLWDPEGGQYGTASRIMADFVDQLAAEVKKRQPDKTIIYLPYLNYTKAPPGYSFPGNVEVQLCGMPGIAQYKEPAIRASEQANIDRWVEITGRKIQNWHYSCWPADKIKAPYQYVHVLKKFYQGNRKKIVGSFINGVGDHWPRQHVSLYCWMKLLWNPDFDVDAAIDEYCRRMFGPAARPMRELVALQLDGWEKSRWPGGRLSPKAVYQVSYPRATVLRMQELLEEARRRAAGDETALGRIDYYETPFGEFVKEFEAVIEGKGQHRLVAKKVGENPVIDGRLDDPVWQGAPAVSFFKHAGGKEVEPKYQTRLKAVWTLDGVTFGFHNSEPAPEGLVRKLTSRDDSMAWWDDNVEIFLDVTGKKEGEYYQLIINPNSAVADLKTEDAAWNIEGAKIRAHVSSEGGKDFWSVEAYLPYSAFPDAVRPATGVEWYGQFTRHRISDSRETKGSLREYTRMNHAFGGPSRNLSDFAPVKFIE